MINPNSTDTHFKENADLWVKEIERLFDGLIPNESEWKPREYIEPLTQDELAQIPEKERGKAEAKRAVLIELQELRRAKRNLRGGFDEMAKCFAPNTAEYGYEKMHEVMAACFIAGSRATISASTEKAVEKLKAANARKKRANKDEELALLAAIKAERGDGPVAKPTKEANVILDAANQRLKSRGFKPVKVDVIRRRLEKYPRS